PDRRAPPTSPTRRSSDLAARPRQGVEQHPARDHGEAAPRVRRLGDEEDQDERHHRGEIRELQPGIARASRTLTRPARQDEEARRSEEHTSELQSLAYLVC